MSGSKYGDGGRLSYRRFPTKGYVPMKHEDSFGDKFLKLVGWIVFIITTVGAGWFVAAILAGILGL